MYKKIFIVFLASAMAAKGSAQQNSLVRSNQLLDITGTAGASQGSMAGSFVHNWGIFEKRRFEIGIGARWSTYFGSKKDYITAGPAKYTRSFTFPFVIFFAGQEEQNFDTLSLQRPLTHSINVMINLGYNISPKWYAGFNIDLIGYSFGRKTSGIFTHNGITKTDPMSKPSAFNILLTGDHDKGSLNSEFYLRYKLNDRWNARAVYQFFFSEYQAQTVSQTFADGTTNDRFRNKANNFGLGVSYQLK